MAALGWLLNLGFAGGDGAVVSPTPEPVRSPGGVSRAMHWAPDRPVQYPKRKLTNREEKELKTLVRKAIDYEDEQARKRLEALARKYRDFENSLASFAEAFQGMSEINRRRFEQHRISVLAYQRMKEEIEEEEAIILRLIEFL